ncbi:MAG: hypothetical protein JSU83_20720 [Deltaproteobacteria bacterium]|nr:MAG: hypothetical protein JSU83_20720 [Deltaproteobacteria bacterium]
MVSKADLLNGLYQALALWRMVLPAMFVGCLCGNFLQGTRIWRLAEYGLHSMARFMRLPPPSGPYLAVCFLNRYAANTMLAGLIKQDRFPPKYLLAVFLAGWFPTILYFYIFYIAPALAAAVGVVVAGLYSIFYLGFNLLIALAGIGLGILLRQPTDSPPPVFINDAFPKGKHKWRSLIKVSLVQFARIAVIFVPVTLLFAVLINIKQATAILERLNPFLSSWGLPSAAVLVIFAGLPSKISGIAAIGPIYQSGLLTSKEVIVTLLSAAVFHAGYEFFASFLPANLAIFGPSRGWMLSGITIFIRLLAIGLMIVVATVSL